MRCSISDVGILSKIFGDEEGTKLSTKIIQSFATRYCKNGRGELTAKLKINVFTDSAASTFSVFANCNNVLSKRLTFTKDLRGKADCSNSVFMVLAEEGTAPGGLMRASRKKQNLINFVFLLKNEC